MATITENRMGGDSTSLAKPMKRNKPLMEKRRRERINASLNELKTLVLEALKKDTSQYSKLEKADILEMTVRHLRSTQRQQLNVAAVNDSTVINKYRAGFSECASEVVRYLNSVNGLDNSVRHRVTQHLTNCSQRMHHDGPPSDTSAPLSSSQAIPNFASHPTSATLASSLPGTTSVYTQDTKVYLQSNNNGQFYDAFRVIPASKIATHTDLSSAVQRPSVSASSSFQPVKLPSPPAIFQVVHMDTRQGPPQDPHSLLVNSDPDLDMNNNSRELQSYNSPRQNQETMLNRASPAGRGISPPSSPTFSSTSSTYSQSPSSSPYSHQLSPSFPTKYRLPLDKHPFRASPDLSAHDAIKEEKVWRPW